MKYGPDTEFIEWQYSWEGVPNVTDRDVIMVDFSFKGRQLEYIIDECKSLLIIDHHIGHEEEIEAICNKSSKATYIFDNEKSGASLAYQHFYPTMDQPYVIKLVEDRDLWKFTDLWTHEFYAGSRLRHLEIIDWVRLITEEERVSDIISNGKIILQYQKNLLEPYKKRQHPRSIVSGKLIPFIPCTHLISEVGNILCAGEHFSCTYFDTAERRVYSLRSDEKGMDVSEVAKYYGGGGHRHAAGFSLDYNDERLI